MPMMPQHIKARDILRQCISDADDQADRLAFREGMSVPQAYIELCLKRLAKWENLAWDVEQEKAARTKAGFRA